MCRYQMVAWPLNVHITKYNDSKESNVQNDVMTYLFIDVVDDHIYSS